MKNSPGFNNTKYSKFLYDGLKREEISDVWYPRNELTEEMLFFNQIQREVLISEALHIQEVMDDASDAAVETLKNLHDDYFKNETNFIEKKKIKGDAKNGIFINQCFVEKKNNDPAKCIYSKNPFNGIPIYIYVDKMEANGRFKGIYKKTVSYKGVHMEMNYIHITINTSLVFMFSDFNIVRIASIIAHEMEHAYRAYVLFEKFMEFEHGIFDESDGNRNIYSLYSNYVENEEKFLSVTHKDFKNAIRQFGQILYLFNKAEMEVRFKELHTFLKKLGNDENEAKSFYI